MAKLLDEQLTFKKILPIDGVGLYYYNQVPLKFVGGGTDRAATTDFPEYSAFLRPKQIPPVIKHTRLVYIQVSCDGFISTRSFEIPFTNANDGKIWAIKKIAELDACPPNLQNFYDNDPERCGVGGLDQNCEWSALIFFYIMNRANKFAGKKFSSTMINRPPVPGQVGPFTVIASSNGQFFGLYNIHQRPLTSPLPPQPWEYKFNLHLEAEAVTGDTPKLIPWLIDPIIRNQGPP